VQIKVDLDRGCFTTNPYQDFAQMEGLDPSKVRLRSIGLMVDEHGWRSSTNSGSIGVKRGGLPPGKEASLERRKSIR
jgi:hypothetical protein